MFRVLLFICLITMISLSAGAKLNLNKDIPGGTDPAKDGEELYQGLTADNALVDTGRVYAALSSFMKLTELSRKTMSKDQLRKIGNTDWEIQNIGFDNWIGGIDATILKQEYLIKQLKYELAQERYRSGGIKKEALEKARKELEAGEKKFQKFWDKYNIVD